MKLWKFSVENNVVKHGDRERRKLTPNGCNEPFKDRYWCPKAQWFRKESCPFINQRECSNYEDMCGSL